MSLSLPHKYLHYPIVVTNTVIRLVSQRPEAVASRVNQSEVVNRQLINQIPDLQYPTIPYNTLQYLRIPTLPYHSPPPPPPTHTHPDSPSMICAAAVMGHLHWNTDLAMELFLPVGITPTRMLGVTGANWGRLMLTPLCCWVLSSRPLITSLNRPSPPTVITL